MAECPWYVSAAAVRRYMALAGVADFDDASDALIEYAAETWRRYQADAARAPKVTRTGAYVYRGPGPRRLKLVVSMATRAEGDKPQLVDVAAGSERGDAWSPGAGSVARRRASRRAGVKRRKPARGGARPGAGRPTTTGSGDGPPVSYRLSAADRARAVEMARERGTTVNALARDALQALLGTGANLTPPHPAR
jgi:hypothetical protein